MSRKREPDSTQGPGRPDKCAACKTDFPEGVGKYSFGIGISFLCAECNDARESGSAGEQSPRP